MCEKRWIGAASACLQVFYPFPYGQELWGVTDAVAETGFLCRHQDSPLGTWRGVWALGGSSE